MLLETFFFPSTLLLLVQPAGWNREFGSLPFPCFYTTPHNTTPFSLVFSTIFLPPKHSIPSQPIVISLRIVREFRPPSDLILLVPRWYVICYHSTSLSLISNSVTDHVLRNYFFFLFIYFFLKKKFSLSV